MNYFYIQNKTEIQNALLKIDFLKMNYFYIQNKKEIQNAHLKINK